MKKIFFLFSFFLFLSCTKNFKKNNSRNTPLLPNKATIIIKANNFKQLKKVINDSPLIKKNKQNVLVSYFANLQIFDALKFKNEAFYLCLAFSEKNNISYNLIVPNNNLLLNTTIFSKNSETILFNTIEITKFSLKTHTNYTTTLGNYLLISNNKPFLESSIVQYQNNIPFKNNVALKSLENNTTASLIINSNAITKLTSSWLPNASKNKWSQKINGWIAGDIKTTPESISFNGVYQNTDTIVDLSSLFKGIRPLPHSITQVTPITALSHSSITYQNYQHLKRNISFYNTGDNSLPNNSIDDFLLETEEFGEIELESGKLLGFSLTQNNLDITTYLPTQGVAETYSNISIFKLENPIDFSNNLNPLISKVDSNFYSLFNQFIVFSSKKETLKTLISAIKNKSTLNTNPTYNSFTKNIANQSNAQFITTNTELLNNITKQVDSSFHKSWKKTTNSGFNYLSIQITDETNFSHLHIYTSKKESSKNSTNKSIQKHRITLTKDIATIPQLVTDYKTKNKNIIVQTKNNSLHLLSTKGTSLWEKEINEPILGNIQQMDMYKNGRLQFLFTTPTKLYVLDKNGKNVAPFPLKLKSNCTQPVALFDYDNNKKYRIAVVFDNNIKMYNQLGKQVKGFKFKNKAKGTITHPPKHIRVGSSDYIVINESNGGVHFVNRTGKERVKLKKTLKSNNEWYWHKNAFTTVTPDNQITQVSTKGIIKKRKKNIITENTSIDATSNTWVSLSENKLLIKNKTVELPFGIYSYPEIFYIKNKIYVSVTDTQAKRVYLFDSNAKSINGFPVTGNSSVSINTIDRYKKNIALITKGRNNELLIYEF